MKNREPKLTHKQLALTKLLACDYNLPEAAVQLGIDRRCLEGIAARIKNTLQVKYLHGIVGEAERLGLINNKELRKQQRPAKISPPKRKT